MSLLTLIVPEAIEGHQGVGGATAQIMLRAFGFFQREGIEVRMLSLGASKVNVTFCMEDRELVKAVRGLHRIFFEE